MMRKRNEEMEDKMNLRAELKKLLDTYWDKKVTEFTKADIADIAYNIISDWEKDE